MIAAAVLAAALVLAPAADAKPDCLALGHRVYHSETVTENTAPGFKILAQLNAWADTDLRVTSDGVAVHSHDRTLRRTFGVGWKVEDHTWAELSTLRTPTGQRLMTWTVATRLSARWHVPIVAEMKQDVDTWTDAEIQAVTDAVGDARVWLGGQFNGRVNAISPGTRLFWRADVGDDITPAEAQRRHASLVMAHPTAWDADDVAALKQAGIRVGSRTAADTRAVWRQVVASGVGVISTNRPADVQAWCA